MTSATIAFWDKLAERYAAQPVRDPSAYEATLARVRTYLRPEDRVLEVGCGTGTTALKLADAAGHITATDFSEGMTRIGERKAEAAGAPNVTFKALGADAPDLQTGDFDVTMGFNLLHLVDDPEQTLKSLAATLKPGGTLITKTPCLGESVYRFMGPVIAIMRLLGKAPKGRIHAFRITELDAAIEAAGFKIVETGNYPLSPPNHFVVARKL